MTETIDSKMTVTPRELFLEARGAHQTSRELLPLLSLLEEPEGSGGLDQIKQLLGTIVEILGQHSQTLGEIKAAIERDGRSRIV